MMALEVIVGSELVLPIKTYEDALSLVTDIMPHIPWATYRLLYEMLFEVRAERVVLNAKTDSFETMY